MLSLKNDGDSLSPLLEQYKTNHDSFDQPNKSYDCDLIQSLRESQKVATPDGGATNAALAGG